MTAAPQPSFSCLKNGTSSQIAVLCSNDNMPQRYTRNVIRCGMERDTMRFLAYRDDDENQDRNGQDGQNEIAVIQITGGKVGLCFIGPGGKLRQFLVIQGRHRGLYLLGIHIR